MAASDNLGRQFRAKHERVPEMDNDFGEAHRITLQGGGELVYTHGDLGPYIQGRSKGGHAPRNASAVDIDNIEVPYEKQGQGRARALVNELDKKGPPGRWMTSWFEPDGEGMFQHLAHTDPDLRRRRMSRDMMGQLRVPGAVPSDEDE